MAVKRARAAEPPAAANASRKRVKTSTDKPTTNLLKPTSKPKTKAATISKSSTKSSATTKAKTAAAPAAISRQTYTALPSRALKAFVCGDGTAGELGLGNVKGATDVMTPKPNPKLSGLVSVVAGGMHGIGIDSKGRVLTWGCNDESALGRPTPAGDDDDDEDNGSDLNPKEATPTLVPGLPSTEIFTQVAAGDNCSFALTDKGHVWGWGTFRTENGNKRFSYAKGQKNAEHQMTPVRIEGLEQITQICAGANFALALNSKGKVYGWGPNETGENGYTLRASRSVDPEEVYNPHIVELPARAKIASIYAGLYHAFAVDASGHVWAWGLNNFAQTGLSQGAGSDHPVINPPKRVSALQGHKLTSIAAGAHHTVAATASGECLVWGRIDGSQMGLSKQTFQNRSESEVMYEDGKPRILLAPSAVPIPPTAAVAAGTDHCVAVTQAGKAYAWGLGASGQCGSGKDDDVEEAKLISEKWVKDEKFVDAAGGGQFSMFFASA